MLINLVLLARLGRADGAALLAALVPTWEFPPPSTTSAKSVYKKVSCSAAVPSRHLHTNDKKKM
jgi:hypothetical protein